MKAVKRNPLKEKSYLFALKVVQLVRELQKDKKEFVMSKQLLRSGTGIGAQICESEFGRSKADFSNKLSIALKEANETEYWLKLLVESNYIKKSSFKTLQYQCKELIAMLVSSVKTSSPN